MLSCTCVHVLTHKVPLSLHCIHALTQLAILSRPSLRALTLCSHTQGHPPKPMINCYICHRPLTWHGSPLEQPYCPEAGPDLAPDAEQVKGQGVGSAGGGTELLLPEDKARGCRVAKHQLSITA